MEAHKTILFFIGVFLVIGVTYAFTGTADLSAFGAKTVINIWHPWGGDAGTQFRELVEDFNESQEELHVRPLFVPNNLSANQKFFLSVKAQNPPEVIFVDGPQVAQWAESEVLIPLDNFFIKAGIGPDDFWEPCWRQNFYRGHSYAITFNADPNFAFGWNKEVFRKAGLDPNKPPRTFEEIDQYNEIITEISPVDERIIRIGIIPWATYGGANSIFTFGWAFGGSFFDYENNRVTAHHPRNVAALEWMRAYADRYGIERIAGFQSTFGSGAQHPFYTGKMAMAPLHITELKMIDQYMPELDFGLTTLPTPEGGEEDSSWVGGWCVGLPRHGAHREAAFEFIRWMCATPEGTQAVADTTGSFPGYLHSPAYEEAEQDPRKRVFLEVLRNAKHQRPVMPAQGFYMNELGRAIDDSLRQKLTPEHALRRASENTQEELDKIIERREAGEEGINEEALEEIMDDVVEDQDA